MPRLIHLNGLPGVGKSTLARMYVEEHHGVLNCDVDVLRTMIGGWSEDFVAAGGLIRPAALAMIEAYLASGHDVVLPQMLLDPAELARFEGAATAAGAAFVERVLLDETQPVAERFRRRGSSSPEDPWHEQVRAIVADQGGDAALARWEVALRELVAQRPEAQVVASIEDDLEGTYRAVLESLS